MRAILEELERIGRPLGVHELARKVNASPESTRRALRNLRKAGRVSFLGVHSDGGGRWCSPSNFPELSRLWKYLRGIPSRR